MTVGDPGAALKSSDARCAKLAHHDGPNVRLWRNKLRLTRRVSETTFD
jgi:hypothetical protein